MNTIEVVDKIDRDQTNATNAILAEAQKIQRKRESRARVEKISATQIGQFLDCPRKWFFKYILGFKTPPTPAMLYGSAVHKELEEWIEAGIVPTSKEARHVLDSSAVRMPELALDDDQRWVPTNGDEILVEFNAQSHKIMLAGAALLGYLDVVWETEHGDTVIIRDWKVRSRFNYAPTSAELQDDIQALLYSYIGFHLGWDKGSDFIIFEHVNILRADKGGPAVRPVRALMHKEQVESKVKNKIEPLIERMRLTAQRELARIRMHKTSCFKYGKCEHKERCYAVPYIPENFNSNGKGGDSTMGHSLADLMGGAPAPAPTNNATPTPAPAATPAAPDPVAAAKALLAQAEAEVAARVAAEVVAEEEAKQAELAEARLEAKREAAELAREDGPVNDPVAAAKLALARAEAGAAAALLGGEVVASVEQQLAGADVSDLMATNPNITSSDVEADRQPVDSHTTPIAEFAWKQVDGVGDKAAAAILAWAVEKGLTYVSELEGQDLKEIPGVGDKASSAMRAKIAEKRPFKPEGIPAGGDTSGDVDTDEQEAILVTAKKAVLGGKVPTITGLTHANKLAFLAWQKEQREAKAEWEAKADASVNVKETVATEEPAAETFRKDMAEEYDRPQGQQGLAIETIFFINCAPDNMAARNFDDLLAPIMRLIEAEEGTPFWDMPNDYGNGRKLLGFQVLKNPDQFKGPIAFFGDEKKGALSSAVREMCAHADMVVRG